MFNLLVCSKKRRRVGSFGLFRRYYIFYIHTSFHRSKLSSSLVFFLLPKTHYSQWKSQLFCHSFYSPRRNSAFENNSSRGFSPYGSQTDKPVKIKSRLCFFTTVRKSPKTVTMSKVYTKQMSSNKYTCIEVVSLQNFFFSLEEVGDSSPRGHHCAIFVRLSKVFNFTF